MAWSAASRSGRALDVRPADREQRQAAAVAPGGELAQVQGVGFVGQPAVPARIPPNASRS